MAASTDRTTTTTATTTRRDALRLGGLAVSLSALAAACGEDRGGDDAPGRVGNAPDITAPPNYEIDEAVVLRTASSLEFTMVSAYETAMAIQDAIPSEVAELAQRVMEDHRQVAETMVSLTEEAGGEPWTCSNPWLIDRLLGPVIETILSPIIGVVLEDTSMVQVLGEELPLGDTVTTSRGDLSRTSSSATPAVGDEVEFERFEGDVSTDVLNLLTALENLAASSHQELVLTNPYIPARVEHARAAALAGRHASWMALRTGPGDNWVAQEVLGEESTRDDLGAVRQFAIPSVFGQVAQIEFIAGPGDVNAVRQTFSLQTPADNSFVYNELTCDA
ncbi:hypothetical protein [Ilumatobacter sp.]|uniref:hypothetical protein n=1 Tax=Ilumatobacter sp. TaxID=1967498 RepID=UPI003B525EF6